MNKIIQEKIKQKINQSTEHHDEILKLVVNLEDSSNNQNSFSYGIVIGRLYNSFYYQCRRILKKNPTEEEFLEFLEILKQHKSEILAKIQTD